MHNLEITTDKYDVVIEEWSGAPMHFLSPKGNELLQLHGSGICPRDKFPILEALYHSTTRIKVLSEFRSPFEGFIFYLRGDFQNQVYNIKIGIQQI